MFVIRFCDIVRKKKPGLVRTTKVDLDKKRERKKKM